METCLGKIIKMMQQLVLVIVLTCISSSCDRSRVPHATPNESEPSAPNQPKWDFFEEIDSGLEYKRVYGSVYLASDMNYSIIDNYDNTKAVESTIHGDKIDIDERQNKINQMTPFHGCTWRQILNHLRSDDESSNAIKAVVIEGNDFGIIEDKQQFMSFRFGDKSKSFWGLLVEKKTGSFCAISGFKEKNTSWQDFAKSINRNVRIRGVK